MSENFEKYRIVYLSLGSNQGDSETLLQKALKMIEALPNIDADLFKELGLFLKIDAVSQIYKTEPQDFKDQNFFKNQVIKLICHPDLEAIKLLDLLQDIENKLGRTRTGQRFGPRLMDIDILLFGDLVCKTSRLELPHPRMLQRAFVLVPLAEIAPELELLNGEKVQDSLSHLNYTLRGSTILQ